MVGRPPGWEARPDEIVAHTDMAAAVYGSVEELEPDLRHTVQLHYYQNLTLQETADAMGVATSTVKYRLRQALTELERKLASEPNLAGANRHLENDMSTIEHEIKTVLRAAPAPAPPARLKEQLIAQVRLPAVRPQPDLQASTPAPTGWLRRWWPVLVPAAVSLACAVGLTAQQMEIRDLKQAIQDSVRRRRRKGRCPASAPTPERTMCQPESDAAARTEQEIARLKESGEPVGRGSGGTGTDPHGERQAARPTRSPPTGLLTPEDTEALAKAKEKAESIACINNLKQLGLSVKVWMIDNEGVTPPDMLSVSNELSTPKVLVCPADHSREAARDWGSYTSANCSYEYLVRSESKPDREPMRVAFRCPIHGHLGLIDGSVQGYVARQHPEQIVPRGGKLYFEPLARPAQAAPPPQTSNPPPGEPPPGGSNQ